uniref:Small nuclear ribonucleoprotein E n=1 Tax=Seriola dumerili TaxID=41447 RepID=A0A3B4U799_SERDU
RPPTWRGAVSHHDTFLLPLAPHAEGNPPLKQILNVRVSLKHTLLKSCNFFLPIPTAGIFVGGMAYRGQGQKVQKVMVQPINLIFRYLQNRSRIQVWLYEQVNMRIEGCIIGGSC